MKPREINCHLLGANYSMRPTIDISNLSSNFFLYQEMYRHAFFSSLDIGRKLIPKLLVQDPAMEPRPSVSDSKTQKIHHPALGMRAGINRNICISIFFQMSSC